MGICLCPCKNPYVEPLISNEIVLENVAFGKQLGLDEAISMEPL
jgi:hypothetical protein